jgi:hypothetical protein
MEVIYSLGPGLQSPLSGVASSFVQSPVTTELPPFASAPERALRGTSAQPKKVAGTHATAVRNLMTGVPGAGTTDQNSHC